MATIGGNLFTRHPKNLNHVHRDITDLLSVIILLGTYVHGGEPFFYDRDKMNDIGKRAHVMKHSHGRCVVGDFDKILNEGSIWTGHRSALSFILHKSIFIHFVHNGTIFYEKYITPYDKKKYIDDDGSDVFPKKKVIKVYNAKYQNNYSNRYYVLKNYYVKDTRIRQTYYLFYCHQINNLDNQQFPEHQLVCFS